MTARIVAVSRPSVDCAKEDDGIAAIAGELLDQHGPAALDVVEGWAADERTTSYGTGFWRDVIDELRRRLGGDRREASAAGTR
jgi:hypothetical protein